MQPIHWMVRLARIAAMLFVLLGCLMIFIYTPFYSQMMVKLLNHFVPVEVNEVAAESQKQAALSEHESLEPGSTFKLASSLFNSKTEIGSINTVEPELEISCTKPLICPLYSSFTGIT